MRKNAFVPLFAGLVILLIRIAGADTVIGTRCYAVEPFGAPQDNATERLWVVERGMAGSRDEYGAWGDLLHSVPIN